LTTQIALTTGFAPFKELLMEPPMPLPSFIDARDGDDVYVNLLLVQFVRYVGQESRIVFGQGNHLSVSETPAQVAEKLWEALKAVRG
jgi:hypothetical protein